jgi:hypothetical protein
MIHPNPPRLPRKYPAVVQWSDTQLGDRLRHLHRALSTLADRHSELVEGLRPIAPGNWTNDQII